MEVIRVENYDVVVIGGGHAGCEAALACARQGFETALFVISLDSIAFLACNPSIGGTSKGHLVREIDALGGEMALNADRTFIQSRMLNRSKGPAVHSLRVQADKQDYHNSMKRVLENTEHLDVIQGEVTEILESHGAAARRENGCGRGIRSQSGDSRHRRIHEIPNYHWRVSGHDGPKRLSKSGGDFRLSGAAGVWIAQI